MDEEEWFFNSFKRYNELQMFDFPRNAIQIDLTKSRNLCVALEEDHGRKNEILIFQLPSALQTKSTSEFTKLERHLSFDHGYFTDSPLIQMKCTARQDNMIISEKNGVALFDLTSEDSDIIRKVSSIPAEVEQALLTVHSVEPYVVLCDGKTGYRSVLDYEKMEVIFCLENVRESMIPMFTSTHTVSFGMTTSACVISYDIRDGKQTNRIVLEDFITISDSTCKQWTFNSTFECCSEPTGTNFLYVLADNGLLMLFDWRNTSQPVQKAVFSTVSKIDGHSSLQLNVSPSNLSHFALSGFDEHVYICEMKDNLVTSTFIHDGHTYCRDEYEPNVKSICSKWLPFISPNTLVSCANNASLQCWQYKTS